MRIIAVLPTGDWAEVAPIQNGEVLFYEMTEDEFTEFQDTGGDDTTLGKIIGSYSKKGFQQIYV